jgi:hypothetical protein
MGSVELMGTSVSWRHRVRSHRGGHAGMRHLVCIGGTLRLLGQPGKQLRLVGARALWRDGCGWIRLSSYALAELGTIQHNKQDTMA